MIGQTEETLTSNKLPYEVGIAKYSELAKSLMLGDEAGMLKLLFHPATHKLLGVHALGQRATEIIHIGQAVLFYGRSPGDGSAPRRERSTRCPTVTFIRLATAVQTST